jgi:threonine dehydrogenase-like Zn-dependent dehydrogenase
MSGPVLDPTQDGFADVIAELTAGVGVDVVAECSGRPRAVHRADERAPAGRDCPDRAAHQAGDA